jgi:hypothetical protein
VPALAGRDLRLAGAAFGGAAAGGTVFFLQHAFIVGPAAFVTHLLQQFLYRSWVDDNAMARPDACIPQVDMANIPIYYLSGYRPLLPLLALLLVAAAIGLALSRRGTAPVKIPWRSMAVILFLVGAPPLLHHLLLPGFTAQHSYAVLKSGFALAVLAAVLTWLATCWRPAAILALVGLPLLLIGLAPQSVQGYRDHAAVTAGGIGLYRPTIDAIRAHADPDEVVFLFTPCMVRPQVLYLTGRNIQPIASEDQARQWLRESPHGVTRGIVFARGRDSYARITVGAD